MGLLERYRERLPLSAATPLLDLGEGGTPLLQAPRLSERLGFGLYLKWEGANPSGSFKDRGMVLAVAKALEEGSPGVICASTGNTAASAAAYAARAGLEALIVLPRGAVAGAKAAQVAAAGATLIEVDGSFSDAFSHMERLSLEQGYTIVNSTNPYRLQGQKTAAFEVVEELGRTPDYLALPYGGGGNTTAYALGFAELGDSPTFLPVQAAERATTVASAIRIIEPVHEDEVKAVLSDCGGGILTVTDEEIVSAWRLLARQEGLFCEPASAAGLAGIMKAGLEEVATVVCVVTGHGLKDTAAVSLMDVTKEAL